MNKIIKKDFWKSAFVLGTNSWGWVLLELIVLALGAIWVGRAYLDFNPRVVPAGREYLSTIQTNYLWERFSECGWCALWNGSERGGYPAFAEIHGSALHPLVAVSTLIWGVITGNKITLIATFWVAGLAQWWLAKLLKLGWLPRMWSAFMVMASAHLTGRMELGAFNVMLATAMASLVIPAILAVSQNRTRRAIVLLAISTAAVAVSGSGYIQFGLIALIPAFGFLLFDGTMRINPVWKEYALAGGLTILLAAYLLIPLVHTYPSFAKETDPEFGSSQPLEFIPLNLVINDESFYYNDSLGKLPFPYLNMLYVGWVPVILAVLAFVFRKKEDQKWLLFLLGGLVVEILISSGEVLRPLASFFPWISGVRHPSQIAGLAVPFVLILAAYGLDRLIKLDLPKLSLQFDASNPDQKALGVPLGWIVIIPLLLSLRSVNEFSKNWIYTVELGDGIYQLLDALETPDLQWVEPPFGEHYYIAPAVGRGLKLSPGIMTFWWEGREFPLPVLEGNRFELPPGPVYQITEIDGIPIYARDDQPYAAVVSPNSQESCVAMGTGGWLDVTCNSSMAGMLIVKENMWSGWKAYRDGERVDLLDDSWLTVEAPAGEHIYTFRYLPWDVPVGLALSVLGISLCFWLWLKPASMRINTSDSDSI